MLSPIKHWPQRVEHSDLRNEQRVKAGEEGGRRKEKRKDEGKCLDPRCLWLEILSVRQTAGGVVGVYADSSCPKATEEVKPL